jgi:branched-chain amino acid transport system permease protein
MRSRLVGPTGLVLLLIAVVVTPFISTHYRSFQFAFVAIYLIALLGLNILTGFTGQISLGHGAFMGIGAYTTTLLVVDHGWRDLWTLPVAGILAGAAGIAFGLPATRFAGPYLALATFAIPLSFIGLLKRFPHFTGGNLGKGLPPPHSELGLKTNPSVWLYLVSWIVALAMLALAYLIVRGRLGRSFRAVRDSEIAAAANGVSTAAIKTLAFGISAFFCGIAGGLFAMGVSYVNPDTFPIDLSILLLVGVVLGGAGSIGGMVFGALFVEFIRITWGPAILDLVSSVHHINTRAPGSPLVVYGVVLLLILYVAPAGVAGFAARLLTGWSAVASFMKSRRSPSTGPSTGAGHP